MSSARIRRRSPADDSMEEAIEFGSDYARTRSTEHLVHDRDGLIADQRDFADELTG